jgi:hypothetical protein
VGDLLLDSFCGYNSGTVPGVSPGSGQTQYYARAPTDMRGASSWKTGSATTTSMAWTVNAACNWAYSVVKLRAFNATAVQLESQAMAAATFENGVRVDWRTGFEIDNLGFNVLRDVAGTKMKITAAPILGSGLLAGAGQALSAGRNYSWEDLLAAHEQPGVRYWVESIDMRGKTTLHGPVVPAAPVFRSTVSPSAGPAALAKREVDFATRAAPATLGRPALPFATAPLVDPGQADPVQWRLAAESAIKLTVDHEGWFEVNQPALVQAGLDPAVDPRRLSLFVEGHEIPMVVRGEADGSFDAADGIGFHARGQNGRSTDARVYWLTGTAGAARRIGSAVAPQVFLPLGPGQVSDVVESRSNENYFAALLNGEQSNFFGPFIRTARVTTALPLPHLMLAGAVEPLQLEVGVQGVSQVAHQIAVAVGDRVLATIDLAERDRKSLLLPLPDAIAAAAAASGGLDVSLSALGGDADISFLEFVRLRYPHDLAADDGDLQLVVPGERTVALQNFAPQSLVDVFDVSDEQAVTLLASRTADDGGVVAVSIPGSGPRTILARTVRSAAAPGLIAANRASTWHAAAGAEDLVVIGPAALLPAIEPLQRQRQAEGWTVALVDVEDLYDEFSFGAKEPGAIRSFLRSWSGRVQQPGSQRPHAVLLLGDASFDPRNFLAQGARDQLPTQLVDTAAMETASDDWFTDFDDDGIADLPLGRLPARSPSDLQNLVAKLIAAPTFDTAEAASGTGPVLFVADQDDELSNFVASAASLRAAVAGPWRTVAVNRGVTPDPVGALRQAMALRPPFVSYIGHGAEDLWAGNLLTGDSITALGGGGAGAFWSSLTCLNGFFQDVYKTSLAETLLAQPSGGAFGVWTSSGLTNLTSQQEMGQAFTVGLLIDGLTAGEAARRAKGQTTDLDVRRTWTLLGDPTWRLIRTPAPAPDAAVGESDDAGASAAGGDDATVDGGNPATTDGCACSALGGARRAGSSRAAGAWALVAAALAIARAVRRRRSVRPRTRSSRNPAPSRGGAGLVRPGPARSPDASPCERLPLPQRVDPALALPLADDPLDPRGLSPGISA